MGEGMKIELLDYFAGKALQGILISDQWKPIVIEKAVNEDKRIYSVIAKSAYDLAEAMIEERRSPRIRE